MLMLVTACSSSVYVLLQLIGAQSPDADAGNCVHQLGPLSLDFELSGCVCSNTQIRSVQLLDCDRAVKYWLRYITTADSYLVKLT